jgi:Mycothiol maleylpyruvate isomerase N-terminal domain
VGGLRTDFLEAITAATPLVSSPALAARWEEPSALERFSLRGLAGHLLRAVTSVEVYLDRPEPPPEGAISAAAYYSAAVSETDLAGELHTAIRQRGEDTAAGGPAALAADWVAAADRMRARLGAEPPGRRVRVLYDLVLTLDDYLATRVVELCVHADDLAVSLDEPPPALPEAATGVAVTTLVEVARLRRGDTAVLRALARRERDTVEALRVL